MTTITTAGSSFPGSPTSGRAFFRSDLGFWCHYDGTRWLSPEFHLQQDYSVAASTNRWYRIPNGGYSIFIPNKNVTVSSYVATTNDGSNYWTITLAACDSTTGNGTTLHTFTTISDSADTWTAHDDTPDSQTPTYGDMILLTVAKTSSPGNLSVGIGLAYRLIIT